MDETRLNEILQDTNERGYAVGSFSPRYLRMIRPVLEAAEARRSPAIVQISQKELNLYGITPAQFAREYFRQMESLGITVPAALHLDHTKETGLIREAVEAGFESVMIDASELPFEENIAVTRRVVDYAHGRGVSVEAELGRIGTTDRVETDSALEQYTDPGEAAEFVARTGVDALAVSVGTAHGVYTVRRPSIDYDILRSIRRRTPVWLVLHGGSGVPAEMVVRAIRLEGGGVSKVNIATDLEQALLAALGQERRMDNAWCEALPPKMLEEGRAAVFRTVAGKMDGYLLSSGKAWRT